MSDGRAIVFDRGNITLMVQLENTVAVLFEAALWRGLRSAKGNMLCHRARTEWDMILGKQILRGKSCGVISL